MTTSGRSGELLATPEGKGAMDRIIETLASGIGGSIGWLADHYVLFGLFLVLWLAFGAALVASQGSLDQAWQTIQSWPLVVQIGAWILFLPVMIGLWIWEASGWSFLVRIVLVVGVAGWNLFMFLPRSTQAPA
jgi:hypothetical protein